MTPKSSRPLAATIASIALGTLVACARLTASDAQPNTNTTSATDSVTRLLAGEWTLTRGCGGFAYGCHTPEQLNEPGRYVFSANGRVKAYRGTALLFETNFTITPGGTGENDEHRALLLIGAGPLVDPRPLRVRFDGTQRVFLDEGCCDRFEFEYVRN